MLLVACLVDLEERTSRLDLDDLLSLSFDLSPDLFLDLDLDRDFFFPTNKYF